MSSPSRPSHPEVMKKAPKHLPPEPRYHHPPDVLQVDPPMPTQCRALESRCAFPITPEICARSLLSLSWAMCTSVISQGSNKRTVAYACSTERLASCNQSNVGFIPSVGMFPPPLSVSPPTSPAEPLPAFACCRSFDTRVELVPTLPARVRCIVPFPFRDP